MLESVFEHQYLSRCSCYKSVRKPYTANCYLSGFEESMNANYENEANC